MPKQTGLKSSATRLLAGAAAFVMVGIASPGVAQNCVVTTPIGVGDTGTAIAIQADGKIVLAGYARIGGNDDFALVRYNPDFSLDLSFGTNGIVTTDFFGAQDRVEAIVIQPDGKIVVAGHATNVTRDFAIARYNVDGSLDSTFGTLGKATSDITGNNDEIEGVAVDASGRIVVVGFAQNATLDYVVARYDATGNLDTAGFAAPNGYFVSTNALTNDVATAVAIQPGDGKIVLGGWANNGANDDFSAARFDTSGALDPAFSGGTVLVPVGASRDRAFAMTLQADGKILLAGAVRVGFDLFGVARLNIDGTVDTATFNPAGTFGDAPNVAGRVTTDFTGLHDSAFGVVEQVDNKIVVVGWANWDGAASNVDFALTRYNADGSLDVGFGAGGKVTTAVGGGNDWIDSVALQPNGKIVVGGYSYNGSNDDFAAARYNTDGSLDASCSGICTPLSATEGASTITVTASGRFEMTFDTATGGSIGSFYDLAEDPGKTNDLSAGTNPKGLHNFGMRVAGTNYNSSTDAVSASIHLLEATSTRVRVRQVSGYENNNTGNLLGAVQGVGTYSVYPSGRLALNHHRIANVAVPYQTEYSELVAHYTSGVPPLDTWASYFEIVGAGVGTGNDDFTLTQNEVAGARTDFLQIFAEDWVAGPNHLATATLTDRVFSVPANRLNAYWNEGIGGTVPAGGIDTWNPLTYFKPTSFIDNTDPEVTGRSVDYRGPDSLSVTTGGPWIDASENTGGGDDFNEAEGAYVLTFDPALGLVFDIDGGGTTRYSPFFKIRQWRSLQDPPGVTLEGTPLAKDVDYRADVKPVARAHFAQDLLWHSTLQNLGALDTAPDVGTPGATFGTVNFVAARYGNGAQVVGTSSYFNFPTSGNLDTAKGAIELWYRPDYDSSDGSSYTLGGYNFDGANFWLFEKDNFDNLRFRIAALAQTFEIVAGPASYSWQANDWVHLRFEWDDTLPVATQLKLFVNGVEPNPAGGTGADYVASTNVSTNFQIGTWSPGGGSPGIYDEVRVYGGAGATPSPLAHGGLTASADEFLADTAKDFTFTFVAVNGTGQGEYLYLGADSTFRGLNVALDTLGSGAVDLQWDYWNGTSWSDLELVGGFTDETNDLTTHGTIYWQDPGGWSPYSINGGPDLFYVRASLASGSYTQAPIENVIKTDILLFQYCGDITVAAQTFDFAVPTPTAVELVSFEARGVDGAVELGWETASELNNLGFHVYRATTSEGAYERVTARAIPGLGSSPVGARYSFRDTGLTNGVTYYYKLEDIETTGKTELHGPVSATPGSDSGSGGESGSSTSSSSQSSTTSLITYGDPSANSLRVLKRGSRQLVLELVTEGFYAEPQEDGSVRLEVPGFESLTEVAGPEMPVKRTWVDAVAGRKVKLLSVRARGVEAFTSLRPSDAELPDIVATPEGTVRLRQSYSGQVQAARRRARKAFREDGLSPSSAARIVSVGFQGDVKKALVELAPLRWDESRGQLLLARRLVVRLSFRGREPSEVSTDDARGRRYARKRSHDQRNVVAHLRTTERGLHSVRYEDVMRGRRGVRASTLRLSRQGETVAFHLQPNGNRFKSGSTLYFVSEGAQENAFGNEAVYELEVGAPGEAMAQSSAAPSGERQPVYWHRAEWEEDRYYQAALVEAPDLWLWDLLFAPETKSYPIEVSALAPGASKLSVWLQGVSDFSAEPDHHMRVYVNGSLVEELSWDGKQAKHVDVQLAPGLLREGDNVVELENVGDTEAAYSMVMLDRYALEYPRVALAGDGRLEGRWNAAGAAELSGLVAGTHVLDMSEAQPSWLVDTEVGADGLLRFRAEAGRSYLAVSPEAVYHPAVTNPEASRLKNTRNRADYLVIGPEAFLRAAIPLLELRQSEELKVKAVSIEEVYSEFGFGEPTPEALKDFLSYAYHKWRQPSPRYVLLLGDATFDFKDHLQTGVTNQVPPRMVKTSYLWTASDPS